MEKNTQPKNTALKDPDNWSNPILLITDAESSPQFKNGVVAYQKGDYPAALREFELAAEKGNASAITNSAFMYHHGYSVPQNYETAQKRYIFADKQGLATAQYNLGLMCRNGQGVDQDYVAASKCFKFAAKQGLATAQYNLGVMYFEGRGVSKDYQAAHMWLNIAAMGGDRVPVEMRDVVANKMTVAQVKKAQTKAEDCIEKNYTGY